jgi:succinyl-CoA synthetase beta subunit
MLSKLFNFRNISSLSNKSKKFFDLHEYQSKDIMRKFNIRVQKGEIALTPAEAKKVSIPLDPTGGLILKAQVHAGGRGKGTLSSGLKGGVKVLKTPEEVEKFTSQMIGYNLVTQQTPKAGLKVNAVLVHEGVDIKRQIYIAFILDRNTQGPAIVASIHGGVEIEEVAHKDPNSIIVVPIDVKKGLQEADLDKLVNKLELQSEAKQAKEQIRNLYTMFVELDATQVEINPWATDPSNKLFCIDAKINIDDNAKFRQTEIV